MQPVVALCAQRGVVVGAQVSYRDLAGFGRRFIDVDPAELTAEVVRDRSPPSASTGTPPAPSRTSAPCGTHRPRHPRPTRDDDDGGSRCPALSRRHAWPAHRERDEPGPRDLRRRGRLRRLCQSRRRTLTSAEWSVTADVDRVGARLQGPTLERAVTDELPSEGVVRGSVQVNGDGQPTLFLSDHPVTGGYPLIAAHTAGSGDRAASSCRVLACGSVALVLRIGVERLGDDHSGDVVAIALAGEHAGQPSGLDHAVEAVHRAQLLGDELVGPGPLVLGVDVVEDRTGDLVVDPLGAQLVR
ncbi:allophanate hydrolase [Janibacter hoylei PVAS-1]|uniref:Allophanate hydrolase n=1 Tax=Janibacter hoylei PVAS-1 TaxID=1210046 RepID=K1ER94_9MICO|nr:allophanate hydrolase [Janibacter hoylei PVAS-1]